MNRPLMRTVAVTALLTAGAAQVAHANFNFGNSLNNTGALCGGTNFATCAAVSISWSGNTATVTVTNWGSGGEVFAAVGITGLPSGVTATGTWTSNDPTKAWTLGGNSLSGTPIDQQVVQWSASTPNKVESALGQGYTLTVTFTFAGTPLNADKTAYGVGIHALSGPDPCGSTKLVFSGTGTNLTPSPTGGSTGCYTSTVPEPATIGLLTTGLLGLGGVGFLRRRKKA